MNKKGRTIYHVVFDGGDGKWKVKIEGGSRASSSHSDKASAVAAATDVAKKNRPSQVKIHKKDGTFEKEYTYGGDPERYPG